MPQGIRRVELVRTPPTQLLQNAKKIRILVLTIGERHDTMVSPSAFANLLACCTHLYELTVGIDRHVKCYNEGVMETFIRQGKFPHLKLKP
jgi:hypothetical protein